MYCVNCGVKLSSTEHKCPLCGTFVVNSNAVESAYPNRIDNFNRKINWKYVMKLTSLLLLLFGFISVICDLLTMKKITWSIYVIGSVAYLGCLSSFLYFKNKYVSLIIATISTEVFIFMIALLNNFVNKFLYLIMPFVLIAGIFSLIITWILKRKNKNIVRIIAFFLFFCALDIIAIECLVDLYTNNRIDLFWSIFIVLPILIISLGLIILSFNKKLIDEIKQRVFI